MSRINSLASTQISDRKYQADKRKLFPERKAEENRKYRTNNPNRIKAHNIINDLIRQGKIERQPCVICGEEWAQAHHPDYKKPLVIAWLCPSHHKKVELGTEKINSSLCVTISMENQEQKIEQGIEKLGVLWTVNMVARYFSVTPGAVYKWIASGKIKNVVQLNNKGGRVRIPKSEVERIVGESTTKLKN